MIKASTCCCTGVFSLSSSCNELVDPSGDNFWPKSSSLSKPKINIRVDYAQANTSHHFREKIPAGAAVRQSCWCLEEAEDVCFFRMGFLWWVVCWGPRVDWDMVFCKAAVDLSRSVMGARSGMSRSLHSSSPAWAILTSSRRLPSESIKGTLITYCEHLARVHLSTNLSEHLFLAFS